MTDTPLKVWLEEDGRLLRLRLNQPKANLIDAAMIAALDAAFTQYAANDALVAVLLDQSGPHFSFGASVQEHLPDQCAEMLRGLHGLVKRMLDFPVPIVTAVAGQCLGGGLELALATNRIIAAPDAKFGQPEMRLAVFAPAASVLMPERMNPAACEDLLLTGRTIGAETARHWGLVEDLEDEPEAAALAYVRDLLADKSPLVLRLALRAVRGDRIERLKDRLDQVERLYLDELMKARDPVEGLNAFLEKRRPQWENR